jgi:hypothetical protein
MQGAINRTQPDDASHLRPLIGSYAALKPDKKVVDSSVQPWGPKDQLEFYHPELACLLCPIHHLQEILENLGE